MDAGSILAAEALDVQPGDKILDLCAAPGGKALILAEKMGPKGSLVANERSSARRNDLHRVLKEYLPEEVRRQIMVTGRDASSWCLHETAAYDRILLDAPCSSERHVLTSPKFLDEWSERRTRNLATQQHAMLASALLAVKPGGRIVYSTCALSPLENDGVVTKLLTKKGKLVTVHHPNFSIGEKTEYGWMIFPDSCGAGPTYISVLERK